MPPDVVDLAERRSVQRRAAAMAADPLVEAALALAMAPTTDMFAIAIFLAACDVHEGRLARERDAVREAALAHLVHAAGLEIDRRLEAMDFGGGAR